MEGQSSFFRGARNTKVGKYAQFYRAKTVSNTYNVITRRQEKHSIVPIKHDSKEIDPEDIIYGKHISSEDLILHIELGPTTTIDNCSGPRLRKVKIRKEAHSAKIVKYSGHAFTVYTFKPEDQEDKETLKIVWKRVYEGSSQKSLFFPQRFGIGRSEVPMLIVHNELVNAYDFGRKHLGNPILYNYLQYMINTSFAAVRNDDNLVKLSIPVSGAWPDWTINLRTGSWHLDLPSITVRGSTGQDFSHRPIIHWLIPLPPRARLELNPQRIISLFEKHFGDYLHSLALVGRTRHFDKLTDFAPHGLLTFGAVVERTAGIVAHFPSTPTPEWYCFPFKSDVDVRYSDLVPSRVELSIIKTTRPLQANLHFRLRLPLQHRHQLASAWLAQLLDLHYDNPEALVFLDEVRFSLVGTFHHDPSTHSPPAYLFVPPIQVDRLHGMPCIKYPPPDLLFYWSLDRQGTHRIHDGDWDKYGIPKLRVETWIGSLWYWEDYKAAKECLQLKGYGVDGRRYAQDHDYPELIRGDPHNTRVIEYKQPADGQSPDYLCLTSPSSFSLIEIPVSNDNNQSNTMANQEMNPKPGRMKRLVNSVWKPRGKVSMPPDNTEADSDTWSIVAVSDF